MIIGGPYSTSLSHVAIRDDNVFCCVIGEGEETMRELLVNIRNRSDISGIRGIAFSKKGHERVSSTSLCKKCAIIKGNKFQY